MAHKFGDCSCKSGDRIPPVPSVASQYKSIINDHPINFAGDKIFGLADMSQWFGRVYNRRQRAESHKRCHPRHSRDFFPWPHYKYMKTHGSGTSTILCYANRHGNSIGNRMRVVCTARGRVVRRMKRTATLMFSVETCGRVRTESSRAEPQRQSMLVIGKLSIRHENLWDGEVYLNALSSALGRVNGQLHDLAIKECYITNQQMHMFNHILLCLTTMFRPLPWPSSGCFITRIQSIHNIQYTNNCFILSLGKEPLEPIRKVARWYSTAGVDAMEKTKIIAMPGIKPRFLGRPGINPATIVSVSSRLMIRK